MKMEKKTLTSLAIITFLMTSTAVVAMAEDTKSDEHTPGSTIQIKEIEPRTPSASPKKSFSIFNPSTWFSSRSSVEEEKKDGANTPPNIIPAALLIEAPIPTPEELISRSVHLDRAQLEEVLNAARSENPDALNDAKEILISNPVPTVPSSAPVETLTAEDEGWIRSLWNRLWGAGSTMTKAQPDVSPVEDLKGASSLLSHSEEAIPMRTPGKIAIEGDGAPLSVLSFPGDYKLADTLKDKRMGGHPLSLTPDSDEIKGDGFNYYFTVPSEEMAPLNGATLVFQVEMNSNAPAYIEYWDGRNEMKSTPHSGNGEWETLTVELTVNTNDARWFNFYPAILPAVEG
jgi:hypothetical protein